MSYSKQLREKLARLSVELRAIVTTAKNDGNRGLNGDEQTKFAALEAEYTATEASIKSSERVDTIENDLRQVTPDQIAAVMGEEVYGAAAEKENKKKEDKAFSKYLRVGFEGLDSSEKALAMRQFQGATPGQIKNAQTLTTTGGGYTVAQGFSDQLEEAMKFFGGILGVVDTFDTENGAPMPWPTVNDTTHMGRILGVNTQVTETDLTFGQVTFNSFIFTSDSVLVPLALIQDSYFNLDQFIAQALGTRLGRLANNKFTVGAGTTEPLGIQPAVIAAGNTTQGLVGETTSIIPADLVSVMHLVDPAYRSQPKAGFMFHDSTLKTLRQLKDSANRPLWQPGLTAGFGQAYPETIFDRPYTINNDMPVMAASAYPVLYGDFSKYKVRKVAGGTTVLRLVERYADFLQVGYIGFMRSDGNLIDAGTHPIAAFQNSAT